MYSCVTDYTASKHFKWLSTKIDNFEKNYVVGEVKNFFPFSLLITLCKYSLLGFLSLH